MRLLGGIFTTWLMGMSLLAYSPASHAQDHHFVAAIGAFSNPAGGSTGFRPTARYEYEYLDYMFLMASYERGIAGNFGLEVDLEYRLTTGLSDADIIFSSDNRIVHMESPVFYLGPYWNVDRLQLGLGLVYHPAFEVSFSGGGDSYVIDFDSASGWMAKLEWRLFQDYGLGFRYENIDYHSKQPINLLNRDTSVASVGDQVNGNNYVFYLFYRF